MRGKLNLWVILKYLEAKIRDIGILYIGNYTGYCRNDRKIDDKSCILYKNIDSELYRFCDNSFHVVPTSPQIVNSPKFFVRGL